LRFDDPDKIQELIQSVNSELFSENLPKSSMIKIANFADY